jgi:anti-sigma factor RsiW
MNENGQIHDLHCARAIRYVHQRLDGDTLDPESTGWLSRHLEGCGDCRQAQEELKQIQRALRELKVTPFPQDAMDEVWDRTTRTASRRAWTDWRALAAAAVVALAFFGIWQVGDRTAPGAEVAVVEAGLSDAELARATAEARFVLNLTATALRRSERAAIGEVMGKRVTPALQRIPLLMPNSSGRSRESRENGEDDV